MKRFLITSLLITLSTLGYSQVVTINSTFPNENSTINLTFFASEGNKGLENYTGDVYAHTGVITNKSTSDSDWKNVKTNWGENTPETKLTRIGSNSYIMTIANPRQYYNVAATDTIKKLAFVFRSSVAVGGSYREGKDVGDTDIFITIYNDNLNVKFEDPGSYITIRPVNEAFPIQAVAGYTGSGNLTMKLRYNNVIVETVQNDTLIKTVTVEKGGVNTITIIANDDLGAIDSTSIIMLGESGSNLLRRPASVKDGINYISDTSVILSLFAPHKRMIYLIGDFNDYELRDDYLMNKDVHNADSVWYWIQLDNLTPSQEYGFQYFVDGELKIADPYSEKILTEFDDKSIPASVYPNLKPYPVGKTEFNVSVMQPGKPAFQWEITDFQKPAAKDLVIYELLVRDFVATHSYKTLTDTIAYIKRMGFNAIELMPIMEFEQNESWGYNPSFHLAVDKYYGTSDDLKRFIDACHKNGIAVILDMVLNHAFGQSPLVQLWNEGNYGAPTAENPYLNTVAKHPFNVGYDFNHESYATKYFVDRVNEHWLKEYHFDGFRYDLSKGFTQVNSGDNVGLWGNKDNSRIAILKRMADKVWEVDSDAYVILEHFATNSEEIELSNYGMMLWNNQNHTYLEGAMGYNEFSKSDFSSISWTSKSWNKPLAVGYMESHDEERMMFKNISYGNVSGNYSIKSLPTALERVKLASAFFFLVPGPKMVWQFGELGYDISIDENGRTGNKPIKWDYYSDPNRLLVYKSWKALLDLRNAHRAFTSDSTVIAMNTASAIKSIKLTHPDMNVYILGNFGVTNAIASLSFPNTGTWYDYIGGDVIEVTDQTKSYNLKPGEFRIWTTKQFPKPESGLFTSTEELSDVNTPTSFELYQNYPNPFNPSTTIKYAIKSTSNVEINVYNIVGKKVATLVNGVKSAGTYTVNYNASGLSSGMYFIQMKVGSQVFIKKATLIK